MDDLFGGLFDLDGDGRMDAAETAMSFMLFDSLMKDDEDEYDDEEDEDEFDLD